MADHDPHLEELMRQCATATPLNRLSGVEQAVVFRWLIDGGHMTRTGQPLETPLQAPRVEARKADGSPIYAPGTDFSTHKTVTMR
ncbi:hypothetical protein ACF1BQ_014565 [Bradyrhizobium sp. RDT10]